MDQKELQEKLTEYQMIQNTMEALMGRRELLITKIMEIDSTLNSIEEMKTGEILMTLGSGIHIPGSLRKTENLIVELGADVAVEENVKNTKKILKKRRDIMENGLNDINAEAMRLSRRFASLEPELRNMMQKTRAG